MKSLDMSQHAWIQGLMSSRFMTETHAKALHKATVEACASELTLIGPQDCVSVYLTNPLLLHKVPYRSSEYDSFFNDVAKAVGMVGLEIRRTVDESSGTHLVALVSVED
jgi:hypothetical protein